MDLLGIVAAVLWALCAAGFTWYLGSVGRQITYVTLADGRRQERRLPLIFRLALPVAPNVTPYFRRPAFAGIRVGMDRKIMAAGYEGLICGEELLALHCILPVVFGFVLWFPFVRFAMSSVQGSFLAKTATPLYLIGPLWFFAYPGAWLRRVLAVRHRSIQRALPFVLDLVTLSVEAGIDFMSAIQRCVERRNIDALAEELIRVIHEIQVGKTRREALRDMSDRVNQPELRSVVSALVQADELGVSIGTTLRIQSEQIRQRRFERAEKLANEAPVKMLAPLLLFIFPAVFLVLLGPVIRQLLQQGF